jgi:hypothetical protein
MAKKLLSMLVASLGMNEFAAVSPVLTVEDSAVRDHQLSLGSGRAALPADARSSADQVVG